MARVLVIVPFAFGEGGMANREAQMQGVRARPRHRVRVPGIKAGPALFDSYHDWVLADLALFEAGNRRRKRASTPSASTR